MSHVLIDRVDKECYPFILLHLSIAMHVQELAEGKNPPNYPRVVDVRDVARAHILAAEVPNAKGRYILSHSHTHEKGEFYEAFAQRFPQYGYPSIAYESKHILNNNKVSRH